MTGAERRAARRYGLALPVTIHPFSLEHGTTPDGKSRDISTRGIYFHTQEGTVPGTRLNMTITIPTEITGGDEVLIHATGSVVRVENSSIRTDGQIGVAATFDRYNFVRSGAASKGKSFFPSQGT